MSKLGPLFIDSTSTYYTLPDDNSVSEPSYKKRKYSEDSPTTSELKTAVADIIESTPHFFDRSIYSNPNPDLLRKLKLDTIVKKESDTMIQLMDQLKLWIIISSPMADEKSTVPYYQEDMLSEFHRAQTSALLIRNFSLENSLSRAKICSKLIKYPGVEDYVYALREHDDQRFSLAHQHLRDIRNMYVALNDMIRKSPVMEIISPSQHNA